GQQVLRPRPTVRTVHKGAPMNAGAIVVVGSINVDLTAHTRRHPRPGETLHGTGGQMLPGGKGANQAVAAARMGGDVRMIGAVGTDAQAQVGLAGLRAAGVDLDGVREVEGPTGLAIVTVAEDGENPIVVIAGANASVDAAQITAAKDVIARSEEHTSELQSRENLVCRLLL